jgi:hypothetical protein
MGMGPVRETQTGPISFASTMGLFTTKEGEPLVVTFFVGLFIFLPLGYWLGRLHAWLLRGQGF